MPIRPQYAALVAVRLAFGLVVASPLLSGQAAGPAMISGARCWRYEAMRPADLAAALHARPVAWLVVSPLEWHGEAISFCSDPLVGHTLAKRAWERAGGVLLPALHVGVETEYKEWDAKKGLVSRWGLELLTKEHNPGSLYVRPITFELVLRDYLAALQREGFRLVVLVTGHGGLEHVQLMERIAGWNWGDMKVLPWNGAEVERGLPPDLQIPSGGHADVLEASLVGGIDPSLVDVAAFGRSERDRKIGLLPENAGKIDPAKGQAILERNADLLAAKVAELLGDEKR